ncbi:MAG: phosphatase PAP2 family protein [Clostridia bacterium]|nr:phosphatase PAP2 family protein [Clostridia bacterium]
MTLLLRCVLLVATAFVAFMVIGRLVSGVHWVTDIIGGALVSAGLVALYNALCS